MRKRSAFAHIPVNTSGGFPTNLSDPLPGFLLPLVPHWEVLLQVGLCPLRILHCLLVVLLEILFLEMGVLAAPFLVEGVVDQVRWPYELQRRLSPSYVW